MAKYRRNRINDAVALEMTEIVREIKDPGVADAMITVTAADVTADLKYAKIYYSVLYGDEAEAGKSLRRAAGFARTQLAKRLNLRMTPELTFVADNSMKHGVEIAAVLNGLDISHDDEESAAEEAGESEDE